MKKGVLLLLLFVISLCSVATISICSPNCCRVVKTPTIITLTQVAAKTAKAAAIEDAQPENYTLGFTLLRF